MGTLKKGEGKSAKAYEIPPGSGGVIPSYKLYEYYDEGSLGRIIP